jgi:hypothetical protein
MRQHGCKYNNRAYLCNIKSHTTKAFSTLRTMLQHHLQLAINAHRGTSFSPEQRGASYVKEFGEQLADDLTKIEGEENKAYYQKKYEALFVAWMSAKCRCISTMITGGSNFPVKRAQKANEIERKRGHEFFDFREKYFERKAANERRAARAQLDPVEQMKKEIEAAERLQEMMVAANKVVRSKKSPSEKLADLIALGITEKSASQLLIPDFANRLGFAPYQLTNNGANIRRMQDRLAVLTKKAAAETKEETREDGITVTENVDADRIQIFFPGKPAPEVIGKLKHAAFKWSPSNGCWQRQLTENAKHATRTLLSGL